MNQTPHPLGATLPTLPLSELLSLRGDIDAELKRRGIIRTGSSVAGELLEYLVAKAYQGTLETAGTKSSDVRLPDGHTIQAKARWLDDGTTRRFNFHDLTFDIAIVALFDRTTYTLVWARELTPGEVGELATPYSQGYRLAMTAARAAGHDVTAVLQAVFT